MNRPYDMPEPPAGDQAMALAKELVKAVHIRDLARVSSLLDAGADPLINTTKYACSAAVDVAIVKFVPGLEQMIRAPRVLNSIDEKGATLLHRAAVLGPPDAILCLSKAGLWLDAKDSDSMTPIQLSAKAGGNGTMTALGPAIPRNVCCLLALGAEPICGDWLHEVRHSIHGMTFAEIQSTQAERGPLFNAVRSLSTEVVKHVMTERMHVITDEDFDHAHVWVEDRRLQSYSLPPDMEPLFNGFFQALRARDMIASVRHAQPLKLTA